MPELTVEGIKTAMALSDMLEKAIDFGNTKGNETPESLVEAHNNFRTDAAEHLIHNAPMGEETIKRHVSYLCFIYETRNNIQAMGMVLQLREVVVKAKQEEENGARKEG